MRDVIDHKTLRAPVRSFSFGVIRRSVKWLGLSLLTIFLVSTASRAIWAAYDNGNFPEALLVKVELLPVLFPLHMVTGGMALVSVPIAFLARHTLYHKWAGRIAAVDVIVAGITAIPVALTAPVAPLAAAGFSVQGVVWLGLIARGIWHIKHSDIRQHRNAMLMMAAVTSGALFFRIYLALWAIYGSPAGFKTFYAFDAWAAWALPLVVAWYWTSRRRHLQQF